jgi:hypothetical protein
MNFPNDVSSNEIFLESPDSTPCHSRTNSLNNSFSSETSDEVDIIESRKRVIEKNYERVTANIVHMLIVLVLIILNYYNMKLLFGYN